MRLQPLAQQAITRKLRHMVDIGDMLQQPINQRVERGIRNQIVPPGLIARAAQQMNHQRCRLSRADGA